jgi:hypothetical protein
MLNKKINGNWLWIAVAQFFVVVLLSYLFGKAQSVYPDRDVMMDGHIHRTLYLDRNFTEEQQQIITDAATRWNDATNHIVDFQVAILPDHSWATHLDQAIVVVIESEDHPDVLFRDSVAEKGNYAIAFFDGNKPIPMLAVVVERLNSSNFEKTMLHELGHVLRLEHNPQDMTLMSPYSITMAAGISRSDLIEFCKIYHCDPNKLRDEEESLHY